MTIFLVYWDYAYSREYHKTIVMPKGAIVIMQKIAECYAPKWAVGCRVMLREPEVVETYKI